MLDLFHNKAKQDAKNLLLGRTCGECQYLDAEQDNYRPSIFKGPPFKYYGCSKESYKKDRLESDAGCKYFQQYEFRILLGRRIPRMRGSVRLG
jgi:hypothetical protein